MEPGAEDWKSKTITRQGRDRKEMTGKKMGEGGIRDQGGLGVKKFRMDTVAVWSCFHLVWFLCEFDPLVSVVSGSGRVDVGSAIVVGGLWCGPLVR